MSHKQQKSRTRFKKITSEDRRKVEALDITVKNSKKQSPGRVL